MVDTWHFLTTGNQVQEVLYFLKLQAALSMKKKKTETGKEREINRKPEFIRKLDYKSQSSYAKGCYVV